MTNKSKGTYADEKIKRLRKKLLYYYKNKNFRAAERVGEALLISYDRFNLPKTLAYEDDMFNTAVANQKAGHIEHAIGLYSDVLDLVFDRAGPNLLVAECLTNLGSLLVCYGEDLEYKEGGCRLLMQALTIRGLCLHHEHAEIGDALYNVGNALARFGKYKEALIAFKTAMGIYTKCQSDYLINCLYVIAAAHEKLDEYEEAYPYVETARYGLANKSEEEYHRAGYYLAYLYEMTGRNFDSCNLYISVMNWLEKAVGCKHPSYIDAATRVVRQKVKLGRYNEAEALIKRMESFNVFIKGFPLKP